MVVLTKLTSPPRYSLSKLEDNIKIKARKRLELQARFRARSPESRARSPESRARNSESRARPPESRARTSENRASLIKNSTMQLKFPHKKSEAYPSASLFVSGLSFYFSEFHHTNL